MHFPSFATILLGVFAATAFASPVFEYRPGNSSTEVERRAQIGNLAERQTVSCGYCPPAKRGVLNDRAESCMNQMAATTGDEGNDIVGVNGCYAVYMWLDDGRLLGGHVDPGSINQVPIEMHSVLNGATTDIIYILAGNDDVATPMKNALISAGFTTQFFDVTSYEMLPTSANQWWEFSATADAPGGVASMVEG